MPSKGSSLDPQRSESLSPPSKRSLFATDGDNYRKTVVFKNRTKLDLRKKFGQASTVILFHGLLMVTRLNENSFLMKNPFKSQQLLKE